MSLDPDIEDTMKDVIFIAHKSIPFVLSGAGDAAYDAAAEGKARLEPEEKLVENPDGTVVQTTKLVTSNIEIRPGDRIWAEGADETKPKEAKLIQAAGAPPTESGEHDHWEARY